MLKQRIVKYADLDNISYKPAWELQEKLRDERKSGKRGDTFIFCQHPPVYTVGKQNCENDWLSSESEIKIAGIDVVYCNRGGRITYHGPGQLVIYFIMKISNFAAGVRNFVEKLEDVSIKTIEAFGIKTSKKEKHPGIWAGDKKLVAIGLHISDGVSMHGIAINVDPNMNHYAHIVPCGIREYGVTSISKLLNRKLNVNEVKSTFIENFEYIFCCRTEKDVKLSQQLKM